MDRCLNHPRSLLDEAWALMKPVLERPKDEVELSGFALALWLRNQLPLLSRVELHVLVLIAMRMQRQSRR